MKTISLTVPMDYNALTRASDMLHGLAIDLSKEQPSTTVAEHEHTITKAVGDASITETTKSVVTEAPAPAPAATEVFASPKPTAETATTAEAPAIAQPAETTPAPVPTAEAPDIAPNVTEQVSPAGVEVDSDGLPWDHRIHALGAGGVHNKLKKTQQWKKKRGVDAALVAEVEAELRAAMSAGPANPVVTTGNAATVAVEPSPAPAPPASPAAASTTAAAAVQSASPAPAPAPAGGTTTFPALMAAITANGIDQAAVTAAVNAQGLQALPLLAARPDLIPAVAAALGV